MTIPSPDPLRILIFMPFGRDALLGATVLENAGLPCFICDSLANLISELDKGGAVVLSTEEALPPIHNAPLEMYLTKQPAWSDLPVLVLTKTGGASPWIRGAYDRLGNLTLLERPVRAPALISAARSAMRARQRQYEMRLVDQRKDEFLAMLAHELRNPMAPISATAQMLDLVADDPAKVRSSGLVINRQIGHMVNLIDDLLDVARVTRGMIRLDQWALDVTDVLSEAVEQVMPFVNLRGHELILEVPQEPLVVLGDRNRLIQVLVNLLNNACKYTPERGRIVASISLSEDFIELAISDNGIGMAADIVGRVFEIFAQAERTSDRSQGGLGLGLALVKNLVSAHGGSVKAASAGLGQGSTFTVRLPRLLEPAAAKVHPPMPDALPSPSSLRILVVDDNVDAAYALGMLLEMLGHKVTVENNAVAALEHIRSATPQVCLLDIGMPEMDGYEMARQLKAQAETADVILVAVTGYGQERDRQMALSSGFNHHLVKPLELTQLHTILASVLEGVGRQ